MRPPPPPPPVFQAVIPMNLVETHGVSIVVANRGGCPPPPPPPNPRAC